MRTILILCALFIALAGCTDQQKARHIGGNYEIDLPVGKRLVNVTWKDDNLWYLVRDRQVMEQPQTYEFIESSSLGVFEGKIILNER